MDTPFIVIAYSVYLPVTIMLTYYVARVLFSNGKVFMLDIFRGREEIAFATNKLFQVGFYLLNIGFALLMLEAETGVYNTQGLFEILSLKVGRFSIYLGVMLFANLYLFFRGKRKSKENQLRAEGKLADPKPEERDRPRYI
ncbi:MAG: hypothetical protein ACO1PI_08315 [Bacteroidota bacterium]|jgi:hypothetical protein